MASDLDLTETNKTTIGPSIWPPVECYSLVLFFMCTSDWLKINFQLKLLNRKPFINPTLFTWHSNLLLKWQSMGRFSSKFFEKLKKNFGNRNLCFGTVPSLRLKVGLIVWPTMLTVLVRGIVRLGLETDWCSISISCIHFISS